MAQTRQQSRVKGRLSRGKGVVTPKPGLANGHKSGLTQVGKVPRDFWLWHLKDVYKVPNTEFLVVQETENPQSSTVGERPEHQVNGVGYVSLLHAVASTQI
jgi:hypothetical protein